MASIEVDIAIAIVFYQVMKPARAICEAGDLDYAVFTGGQRGKKEAGQVAFRLPPCHEGLERTFVCGVRCMRVLYRDPHQFTLPSQDIEAGAIFGAGSVIEAGKQILCLHELGRKPHGKVRLGRVVAGVETISVHLQARLFKIPQKDRQVTFYAAAPPAAGDDDVSKDLPARRQPKGKEEKRPNNKRQKIYQR